MRLGNWNKRGSLQKGRGIKQKDLITLESSWAHFSTYCPRPGTWSQKVMLFLIENVNSCVGAYALLWHLCAYITMLLRAHLQLSSHVAPKTIGPSPRWPLDTTSNINGNFLMKSFCLEWLVYLRNPLNTWPWFLTDVAPSLCDRAQDRKSRCPLRRINIRTFSTAAAHSLAVVFAILVGLFHSLPLEALSPLAECTFVFIIYQQVENLCYSMSAACLYISSWGPS